MTVENRSPANDQQNRSRHQPRSYALPTRIGPSDYVPFLKNKKICLPVNQNPRVRDRPITISAKLEVEDSPTVQGSIDLIAQPKSPRRKIAGALPSMPRTRSSIRSPSA